MGKLKLIIATAAALIAIAATCCTEGGNEPLAKVTLDMAEVEMFEGGTLQLKATVSGGEADAASKVSWESSNDAVAEVSGGGLVMAVSAGEATVTASLGGSEARCLVIVKKTVSVERIIMPDTFNAIIGQTAELEYTILPYDATDTQLAWTSSDESVAMVADGIITGLKLGETTVRATYGNVAAECLITVIDVPVERIELSAATLDLGRGVTSQLTATVWPEEARYLGITWSSSDKYVASVDENGLVKGVAHGPATITVTAGAVTAECEVMVEAVPNVGDYLFSDKTWSAEPNPNKEIVGIVFWVGDPSVDDPMLRSEHPECVNGLAVSLGESSAAWQPENRRYPYTVNSWVSTYTNLPNILTDESDSSGMARRFLGYGTTKSLEAFDAAPENSSWRLEVVQSLTSFKEHNPAAENSSGWYIPSVLELRMLCTGESGGRPDWSPTTNKILVNSKLSRIGADLLESYIYLSTIEVDFESAMGVGFDYGGTLSSLKVTKRIVRFVSAF